MTNIKIFKVSDATFQNFTVSLDLDYYESMDNICKQIKKTLITVIEMHGFTTLLTKAKNVELHIHDVNIGHILTSPPETQYWACTHC
jgi:hypothetical protein